MEEQRLYRTKATSVTNFIDVKTDFHVVMVSLTDPDWEHDPTATQMWVMSPQMARTLAVNLADAAIDAGLEPDYDRD